MFAPKTRIPLAIALTLGALAAGEARAQCAEPTASQFRVDTLAYNTAGDLYEGSSANNGESGNYGVVQIAVAPDGKVFIAKMCSGQVRVYDPAAGLKATTTLAGIVPTHCNNEDGLLGIVVDRNYATNKWVYVFATSPTWPTAPADADTGRNHLLVRYTYDASAPAGQQLKNPKTLLRVQRMIDSRAYHAAGGLDMGADGVLVIGTGDDTSPHSDECSGNNSAPILWNNRGCDAQKSSSNTASLRGKILRIKPIAFPDAETPEPGIGSTYEIPPGNLWEKIDKPAFNPNWKSSEDTLAKVRKEIFSMGHRNPYHPRYDATAGWVFTGEVGLDASAPSATRGPEGREEWNLVTEAGFFGHPYCVGKNTPWRKFTWPNTSWTTDTSYECSAIRNVSPNNYGIVNLPPAKPAVLFYSNASNNGDDSYRIGFNSGETAIGGPMYRYDPALSSNIKFPPQYEGKIFFFDWSVTNKSSFRIIKMNPDGTLDSGTAAVYAAPMASMPTLPPGGYIDMRFGPHDGAMYLLRNNLNGAAYTGFNSAALFRIAYTGPIDNACYQRFNATVGTTSISRSGQAIRRTLSPALVGDRLTLPRGIRSAELFDLSGRKVWTYARESAETEASVQIPAALASGLLQARLKP